MQLLSLLAFVITAVVAAPASADADHNGFATLAVRSLGESEPLCGAAFDGETLAASLPSSFFTNTAANPCGRTVRVTNAGSGDVVTATVTDACAPLNCLGGEDIALSAAALSALGGSTVLPTRVTWSIL